MEENTVQKDKIQNNAEEEKKLRIKHVIKMLAFFCVVMTICPSFLVSCSGEAIGISVLTAIQGISVYGETIVEPQLIMILCILIPCLIFRWSKSRRTSTTHNALLICVGAAVDFVIWMVFRSTVKHIAEEYYCDFETTVWFFLNIVSILLILLLTGFILMKKMEMETDFLALFKDTAANVEKKARKGETIGFCTKCGSAISYGSRFCISCGTPVSESIMAESEAAKKTAEEEKNRIQKEKEEEKLRADCAAVALEASDTKEPEVRFCQNCGAKLGTESRFCNKCGVKVE